MKRISGLLLIIIFLLFCENVISQSKWWQVNPAYPSVGYYDICFSGDYTAWAAGGESTLIKSIDGGITWQRFYFHENIEFTAVFFIDEQTGWAGTNDNYHFFTNDGGLIWQKIPNDFWSINALFFLDENTGWAGTYNEIYKTSDGGQTWELQLDSMDGTPKKIIFGSPDNGYVITDESEFFGTADGGQSWHSIQFEGYDVFNSLFITDNMNCWIPSISGQIYKSQDGGQSWDTLVIDNASSLYDLHFYDALHGIAVTSSSAYITLDGGATWDENLYPSTYYTDIVGFSNNGNISMLNGYTGLLHSPDYGNSWNLDEPVTTVDLWATCRVNQNEVIAAGDDGVMLGSSDSGDSWELLNTNTTKDIKDVVFIDETIGWACGAGLMLFTGDGGESWEIKDHPTNYIMRSLFFLNNDWGVVAADNGFIFKTNDGGENWENVHCGVQEQLNDIWFFDEDNGIAVGKDETYVTTDDGGESWISHDMDIGSYLYSLHFKDENTGWVTSSSGIHFTDDGGESWIQQWGIYFYSRIHSIRFFDDMKGWACGRDGSILQTTDGGVTWSQNLVITESDLRDICFLDNEILVSVGEDGIILKTDQGSYLAPGITYQLWDTTYCEGSYIEIVAPVVGDSLNFRWFRNGNEITGSSFNTMVFDPIQHNDGGNYYYEAYNDGGFAQSESFMISVKPQAEVLASPIDTSVYVNDTLTLSLAVTGALPISYQWQKNGSDIPGAIFNVFPIFGIQLSDSGYYRCIVSNECNADTTAVAKLTVLPASDINELFSGKLISIIPNPVKYVCRIEFEEAISIGKVSIFSMKGELIFTGKIKNADHFEADLTRLEQGIYIIRIKGDGKEFAAKFIKD